MTSHKSDKSPKIDNHHISRRNFLGTTAAGSAALLTGGLATLFKDSVLGGSSFPFVEATILELGAAMTTGELARRDLMLGCIHGMQPTETTFARIVETDEDLVACA